MSTKFKLTLLTALALCLPTAQALTVEELAAQFESYKKQQDVRFEQLSSENAQLKQQNAQLQQNFNNTQSQVSNNTTAVEVISENYEGVQKASEWFNNTTIGGYGELHYQNRSVENGDHKEEVDFHRFVLFFGHEFTDNLRFFSELELEHSIAGDGKEGEIELEQAYLEYDFNHNASVKAGLFLMPVGIMNETHEPDTFYGVERNEVEKNIIPTTWWEAGIGGNYRFDNGLSFDAVISSGLDIDSSGDKAFNIRSGRGKVSKQKANDPIIAVRGKYTGIPALELATTILHQTDLGQSDNPSDESIDVGSGTLYQAHVIYSHGIGLGTFTGKALYSRWEIDIDSKLHQAAESQYGWYIEPSYRFPTSMGDMGIYSRFQKLDYYSGAEKNYDIWEAGANWWPHENVVLKANYIHKEDTLNSNSDERGFDLGIGYQF
ncbi:MAG: porin [Methylococcales symbiont of Iophon sp. n. MRB-2018]|nr:MAG: porin [Methylococcales symbiont of Iophon sp. n. MRB-2018]KAF3979668.1 MAG: porin [Methylococcales symbiont of Iophon sp. n. MRB-2018]